jgi:hypothetical protein
MLGFRDPALDATIAMLERRKQSRAPDVGCAMTAGSMVGRIKQ